MHYVAIASVDIVIFHARGVDLSVLVADHRNPSPDPFLNEQVLSFYKQLARTNQECNYGQNQDHNVGDTRP